MHDPDELFSSLGARVPLRSCGIDHVLEDMVLDYFRDKAVECPSAGRGLLDDARALFISLDCAFNGVELPTKATETIE